MGSEEMLTNLLILTVGPTLSQNSINNRTHPQALTNETRTHLLHHDVTGEVFRAINTLIQSVS